MANLAGEYWATDGGAGGKSGLSLANAAAIDPADANDVWSIINAGAVVSDVTINLCVDGAAITTATIDITKDATTTNRIICQGRNAADTADAKVIIDADGGAFPVFTLTTCDNWAFKDIVATNTNRASGNHAWDVTANADRCTWIRCEANWTYTGFNFASGATWCIPINCLAHNNVGSGFWNPVVTNRSFGCIAHNNGGIGIYSKGIDVRAVAYDNGDKGFLFEQAVQCVSYRNRLSGFQVTSATFPGVCIDCISAENGAYAYRAPNAAYSLYLLRSGDYSNSSGRVDSTGNYIADEDDPGLSADPFVEGAPKYVLAAGLAGCTSIVGGSILVDTNHGGWGGNVAVGDRIRFFGGGTGVEYAEEAVVTLVSVAGDDDFIEVSPPVTEAIQKQCWLGGGNFALNSDPAGGLLCRNNSGRVGLDPWSTDYLDIGARQHRRQAVHLIG